MHMKTATILTLMFFGIGAAPQDVVQSQAHAQCTFSDGTSIVVGYFLDHQRYGLSTNGPLLTTHGTSVPAGDYTVYLELPRIRLPPALDSEDDETDWQKGVVRCYPLCP